MTIQDLKSKNLILLEVISGSKSFGLNTPTSDTDIKGVFYLPKEQFYGFHYTPQVSNETNDEVYYEIGRFIELLLKNNPNILEILASPQDCILHKHPIMEHLKIEDFLSKLCKDSFAGYAQTQIKKARGLNKKIVNPVDKERKSLLDFCNIISGASTIPLLNWLKEKNWHQENCGLVSINHAKDLFALFYDKNLNLGYKGIVKNELSNQVSVSSIPKNETEAAYLHCNHDGYSMYCKKYTEYWDWVQKRNEDRYQTNQEHGQNYDSKNMMHTVRLLQSANQIATEGKLSIKVNNREELLSIKAGNVPYDELMQMTERLLGNIEKNFTTSVLPEKPDEEKALEILLKMRFTLYA